MADLETLFAVISTFAVISAASEVLIVGCWTMHRRLTRSVEDGMDFGTEDSWNSTSSYFYGALSLLVSEAVVDYTSVVIV